MQSQISKILASDEWFERGFSLEKEKTYDIRTEFTGFSFSCHTVITADYSRIAAYGKFWQHGSEKDTDCGWRLVFIDKESKKACSFVVTDPIDAETLSDKEFKLMLIPNLSIGRLPSHEYLYP